MAGEKSEVEYTGGFDVIPNIISFHLFQASVRRTRIYGRSEWSVDWYSVDELVRNGVKGTDTFPFTEGGVFQQL